MKSRTLSGAVIPLTGFIALCLVFLFAAASFAAGSADKGTASGQFLKLGAGARAAGMGEAYSAIADDATAIYWNPAALAQINGFSATFMHAALLADISYDFFGYGQRVGDLGVFGVGVQYLSMPTFHETDSSGFENGVNFNPRDMGVALAYSFPLGGKYSAGVSGKYIRSGIDKSASTFAADFGVLGIPCSVLGKDLRLSFVAQNLGGKLEFDQKSYRLPLNVKLGSSLYIRKNWILGLDVNFPMDNLPYAALGTEYQLSRGGEFDFAGRVGFNSRTLGDVSGFNTISFGAGVNFRKTKFDYAFLPFGTIGVTHRISVTFGFGKPEASSVSSSVSETGLLVEWQPASDTNTLTNKRIISLTKAGTSDSTIISLISQFPSTAYDTSLTALMELHDAGVSSPVIDAIKSVARKSR